MPTQEPLQCWRCGAAVVDEPLPLSRRAECRACTAELHVCRMCVHFNARVSGQCNEDRAEDVSDKTRANFCDYFKPRPDAYRAADTSQRQSARAALDALFGDTPVVAPSPEPTLSAAEQTRRRLDELFKK
ncbi:MAG: hypothetical protein ACFCUG_11500 [Thiotrichales bacterium]